MKVRKILAVLLALVIVLGTMNFTVLANSADIWDGTVDVSWYDAETTEFTFTTAEQLAGLAAIVNGTATDGEGNPIAADNFAAKKIILANSIDLDNKEWTPIGTSTNWFQGNLDGNENTIYNLKITGSDENVVDYAGLFGYIKSGPANYTPGIANLTIENAYISGVENGGALCGGGYTTTKNAGNGGAHQFNDVVLKGFVKIEGENVGGLVGMSWTDYQIAGVNITVDVDAESYINGTETAGGVFASAPHAGIKNVVANINVIGSKVVGGIAGNGGWDMNGLTYTGKVTLDVTEPSEDGKYTVATLVASLAENTYWGNPIIRMFDLTDEGASLEVVRDDMVISTSNGYASNGVGPAWYNEFKYVDGGVYQADVAIGENKYFSVSEAVRNAADGDVIVLEKGRKEKNIEIPAGKNVTIDLNKKRLTGNIINNGSLTIKNGYSDTSYLGRGSIEPGDNDTAVIVSNGNITVEDLYLHTSAYYDVTGFINITGGTAKFNSGIYTYINVSGNAQLTVDGAEFVARNKTWTQADKDAALASDIIVSDTALVTIKSGDFDGNLIGAKSNFNITGGTFVLDPSNVIDDSQMAIYNDEISRYEVKKVAAKIGETKYPTIEAAVAAAKDGDVIDVVAGTHTLGSQSYESPVNGTLNGGILLDKSITLRGAKAGIDAKTRNGEGETIIKGGPDGYNGALLLFTKYDVDVTIDGFTFVSEAWDTIGGDDPGVAEAAIVNNIFKQSGDATNKTSVKLKLAGGKIVNNVFSDLKAGYGVRIIGIDDGETSWGGNAKPEITIDILVKGNDFSSMTLYNESNGAVHVDTADIGNIVLSKNNLSSITGKAVVNAGSVAKVSAEGNYWGEGVPDFESIISGDVTFLPFYADETATQLARFELANEDVVGNTKIGVPTLYKEIDDVISNARYEVVVSSGKADANIVLSDGETAEFYDISLQKNGVVIDTEEEHTVTVTLGTPVKGEVDVYHFNGTSWDLIATCTPDENNEITFTTKGFSPFAYVYTKDDVAKDDIAKKINASLEKVSDTEYDIVLSGDGDKYINRFMSAEFDFDINSTEGTLSYSIEKAGDVNIVYPNGTSQHYEFNLDGLENASSITGKRILLGKLIIGGYGKGTVGIVKVDGNNQMVNVAKDVNNIVETFEGDLLDTTAAKDIALDVNIATQELTIKLDFPNAIENNKKAYQGMKAVITGGDLAESITVELGNDMVIPVLDIESKAGAVVTADFVNGGYVINLSKVLTKDFTYTVTLSGAGYRTATYSVRMRNDKEIHFWNNVNDNETVSEFDVTVVNGTRTLVDTDKKNVKNFLAGDIVKDNNINIYDLAAVVSYFGEANLNSDTATDTQKAYAKYDLNRDGKVDSRDVAYVLVSWGN